MIACADKPLFNAWARCLTDAAGTLVAEDPSDTDGDPAVLLDTRTRRVEVRRRAAVVSIEIAPRGR